MASTEANYSVTVKTPKGNLIIVRGDSALDWVANLEAAAKSGALGVISQIEASLSGQPAATRPAPAAPGPSENWQKTQEQPAQELPDAYGVQCDTCQAPAKLVQEGISKKSGAHYKRFACTANALHKATFTN